MNLLPLQLSQLPSWTDPAVSTFTINWLKESGAKMEFLKDRRYNYALQAKISSTWIGEDPRLSLNVREFHEFRFSAIIELNKILKGPHYRAL